MVSPAALNNSSKTPSELSAPNVKEKQGLKTKETVTPILRNLASSNFTYCKSGPERSNGENIFSMSAMFPDTPKKSLEELEAQQKILSLQVALRETDLKIIRVQEEAKTTKFALGCGAAVAATMITIFTVSFVYIMSKIK